MKTSAIMFFLLPWLLLLVTIIIKVSGIYGPIPLADGYLALVGFLWLVTSPLVMSIGLMVAYREGQYSMKEKKNES